MDWQWWQVATASAVVLVLIGLVWPRMWRIIERPAVSSVLSGVLVASGLGAVSVATIGFRLEASHRVWVGVAGFAGFAIGAAGVLSATNGWVSMLGLQGQDVVALRRLGIEGAVDTMTDLASWRREHLVTIAKGLAGAAVTFLAALAAAMFEASDSGVPNADLVITGIIVAALLAGVIQVAADKLQRILLRDLDILLGP